VYVCYLHDTIPLGQGADLAIDMRDTEQIHLACMDSLDDLQALGEEEDNAAGRHLV